jgi:uncharacterized membrane protein
MRYFNQFVFGGLGYALIEIVYRGYTHISMFVAGGICFCILIMISQSGMPFLLKCLAGGLAICVVEFAAGAVVNLWLGLNVWDYTRYGYHILGQVCLRYFVIWSALSGVVMWGYPLLSKAFKHRYL